MEGAIKREVQAQSTIAKAEVRYDRQNRMEQAMTAKKETIAEKMETTTARQNAE